MKKELDYIVFVGRMQPPHAAHIEIIYQALQQANKVIVLIGSADQPRTIENPWLWHERGEMIKVCFSTEQQHNIKIRGIPDAHSDNAWVVSVQDTVNDIIKQDGIKDPSIRLIGHKKDFTSFYIDMFPQWNPIEVDNIDDIHATDIRKKMFERGTVTSNDIPKSIVRYLEAFMNTETFEMLSQEYDFIQAYKKAWAVAPYEPIFVTVDAVVVQSGHVLLVRRRAAPGKGTWALPGGFLNPNERIKDAMIRELREETKLKVPIPVLKGNIKDTKVFDDPKRSLRGRTVTHAYYIELPPGPLPKVKGSDDADKAKWVSLSTFEKMQNQMFEDHFFIVNHFVR